MASNPQLGVLNALDNYVPEALERLVVMHSGLEEKFGGKTSPAKGKAVEHRVSFKRTFGHGFRASGAFLPSTRRHTGSSSSKQKSEYYVERAEIPKCNLHMRVILDMDLFTMQDVDPTEAGNLVRDQIENAGESLAIDYNYNWYTGFRGIRGKVAITATCTGAPGDTLVDFKRDDQEHNVWAHEPGARQLPDGAFFTFIRNGKPISSGLGHIVQGSTMKVADTVGGAARYVDRVQIDPGLGAQLVDGDVVVEGDLDDNSYGEHPFGLDDWVDDGRNLATYAGISRARYERWGCLPVNIKSTTAAEGAAGYFQQLSEEEHHAALSDYWESTGASTITEIGNPSVIDEYIYGGVLHGDAGEAYPMKVRPNQSAGIGPGKFRQGTKASIHTDHPEFTGGIDYIRDPYCTFSRIYAIEPQFLRIYEWQSWKRDPGYVRGGIWDDNDRELIQLRWSRRFNRHYTKPYRSMRFDRVLNRRARTAIPVN